MSEIERVNENERIKQKMMEVMTEMLDVMMKVMVLTRGYNAMAL